MLNSGGASQPPSYLSAHSSAVSGSSHHHASASSFSAELGVGAPTASGSNPFLSGASGSTASPFSILTPPPREVATSGMLLLQQEVIAYAARRSCGSREEALAVLETAGFQVGVRLLERLSLRLQARVWEQRECLKFICKDLWQILFQKQADRLQTNRRGGYVIQDHSLPWLRRLRPTAASAAASADLHEGAERANVESEALAVKQTEAAVATLTQEPLIHVALVCGIIRGALANMGLTCTVTAEVTASPYCSFQIRIPPS
ncbi:transport protein particle (trapp) component, bet3 protein [Besnoitia besnoiti]|uniref:Transport protein particle (Trapp) component, bet3 protein n=1 Tax=Besnoitia besnoiti TaxID=94643 RepID=A0A2A9M1J0_BESBE|nr:transport protein particle (trapp) component, bet3 protein [Besnoitia besnoiti]PFH31839.1 transport protein particle (trapp) component, bet3 protein [Besnoitia besnoiti]